jgi:hypothetical protein
MRSGLQVAKGNSARRASAAIFSVTLSACAQRTPSKSLVWDRWAQTRIFSAMRKHNVRAPQFPDRRHSQSNIESGDCFKD